MIMFIGKYKKIKVQMDIISFLIKEGRCIIMMPKITSIQMGKIIEQSIIEGDKKPMLFLGKTGIGKTATVEELCKKHNIGHIDIRILNHTETDFKGLPYPDANREFTVYLQNKMFPIAERDGERGILVLDEVTSGFKSVRTAIYQLMQERCIGEYRLPDGWQIICLGNGENDGGDFNGIEAAFGARCECYRVESTSTDYLKYGNSHGVSDLVLAYIEFSPASLHTYDVEKEGTEDCLGFACNRAWSTVSDILEKKGITMTEGSLDEITRIKINGNIGVAEGEKFMTFVDLKREVVSCKDISEGKEVKAPKRTETLFLTASGLKALMCELVDTGGYNGDDSTLSTKLMTNIANCLLWLIKNTSIEITTSCVSGWCHKSLNGQSLFLSEKFDSFCDNSDKYSEINKFFFEHEGIFTLD